MKLLKRLNREKLIHPPKFLLDNTAYLTMMGSVAYGVSDVGSDVDIYGFCLPPKEVIFPHLAGEIEGFGKKKKRFEQWQEHHIDDKSLGKEYDFTVYNIVKYFQLCMDNNPNMIDSLFVPRRCIIHSTQLSEKVRESRYLFLHKGSYYKLKGYAYSQMHKMRNKDPEKGSKRRALCLQCEQILVEHDLDLQRNREQLKSIRRGEWSLEQVELFFEEKERQLEELYHKSDLKHKPDEAIIKNLLLECLEMHYGSLDKCIKVVPDIEKDMKKIFELANKYV